GGEHAHVVSGGLLDDADAGAELGAAEDIAAADDDGELHAALHDALGLPRHVHGLVDTDAALAAFAKPLAAQLEHDAAVLGLQSILGSRISHRLVHMRMIFVQIIVAPRR